MLRGLTPWLSTQPLSNKIPLERRRHCAIDHAVFCFVNRDGIDGIAGIDDRMTEMME